MGGHRVVLVMTDIPACQPLNFDSNIYELLLSRGDDRKMNIPNPKSSKCVTNRTVTSASAAARCT